MTAVSPAGIRKRKSFDDQGMALGPVDPAVQAILDCRRLERHSPQLGSDGEGGATKLSKAGWTEEEDSIVHMSVKALGTQWQAVADRLPGRTADAVRNRWHRLQKRGSFAGIAAGETLDQMALTTAVPGGGLDGSVGGADDGSAPSGLSSQALALADLGVGGVATVTGSDHGRAKWSAEEDGMILRGVRTLGCRWREIAALLPGRSDSSIRNRWHRMLVRGQVGEEDAAAAAATGTGAGVSKGGAGKSSSSRASPPFGDSGLRAPPNSRVEAFESDSARSLADSARSLEDEWTGVPPRPGLSHTLPWPPGTAGAGSPSEVASPSAVPGAADASGFSDRAEGGGLMALAMAAFASQSLGDTPRMADTQPQPHGGEPEDIKGVEAGQPFLSAGQPTSDVPVETLAAADSVACGASDEGIS